MGGFNISREARYMYTILQPVASVRSSLPFSRDFPSGPHHLKRYSYDHEKPDTSLQPVASVLRATVPFPIMQRKSPVMGRFQHLRRAKTSESCCCTLYGHKALTTENLSPMGSSLQEPTVHLVVHPSLTNLLHRAKAKGCPCAYRSMHCVHWECQGSYVDLRRD